MGPAPRSRPAGPARVAIGVGVVTIDTVLLGLIAPLLPEIEQRTGAGDAGLGFALAAYAIPIALLSLPFGRAADAVGRRALLVAGLLFVAVGSVLVAISDSIGALDGRSHRSEGRLGGELASRPGRQGLAGSRSPIAS